MSFINEHGATIASALMGVGVAAVGWFVMSILFSKRQYPASATSFEVARRDRMRAESSMYRWLEPAIDEVAEWVRGANDAKKLEQLQRDLIVAREPLPWLPAEFIAAKIVEGTLAGLGLFLVVSAIGGKYFGLILAVPLIIAYAAMARSHVHSMAETRMYRIRSRLPFAVDLLSLMMEAGASFSESLDTIVQEHQEHPLGQELGDVLRLVSAGSPRGEALQAMQERLQDEDLTELVFAINKGEELGTPLSAILRRQADQMRLKRSQWAEKAAAHAQVKIVFPGVLVMVACLLVVMAPIMLPAILQLLE